MKITILNQYNMPPEYGHLNRHYYLARELSKMGHDVNVIVGSKLHNTNVQIIKDKKKYTKYHEKSFGYYFAKTIDYSNSKFKRVIAMFQYIKNAKKVLRNLGKQDVIIGSSAHPLTSYLAIKEAKKQKALSVVEIRDLWPESIVAYKILSRKNPIIKIMYWFENRLYSKANRIVFTMEGGKDYIIDKELHKQKRHNVSLNKIYHINNGISLDLFSENLKNHIIKDQDLDDDCLKIVYIGAIRHVNRVDMLLEIAKRIDNPEIKFLVYGSGDKIEQLKEEILTKNIDNVKFKGSVEKKYIPYILSKASMNIITGESIELYKYGVSMNKLFDYFASEKPIISTFKAKYSLIEKYRTGIEYSKIDYSIIASDIENIFNDREMYQSMCCGSKKAAQEHDYSILAAKLIECIEG